MTEAIYRNGHLEPLSPLDLSDEERVTLIVQTHERHDPTAREAALQRLLAGIDEMNFHSSGRYPTRDELHERD